MADLGKNKGVGVFLAMLMVLIQLLFQFQLFIYVFVLLIFLMVSVVFFSEESRILVWTIVSFSGGLFAFIYGDRLLLELPLSHPNLLLSNRFLLLFPLILMGYVIYKFKKKPLSLQMRPEWKTSKVKQLYFIVIGVHLLVLIIMFRHSYSHNLNDLGIALAYSFVNAVLVEALWRGVLLARFKEVIGVKLAIFFASISGALAYYLFGYPFSHCLFLFVVGLFLGTLTQSTKSLTPAIIWNFLLTLIFILSNVIPIRI